MESFPQLPSENCPVCKARHLRIYAETPGRRIERERIFTYLQCGDCQSVFLSSGTRPKTDIYTESYYEAGNQREFLKKAQAGWTCFLWWLELRRSRGFCGKPRVLDVGCGGGGWLKFLQDRGYEVHGLEPSGKGCAAAQKRGLADIQQGDLERHSFPLESFDIITANHCLEHAPDPKVFIREITVLLKPGGWVGIAIPNISSWEARVTRQHWYHLDPPYHICLPTPKALEKIMKEAGLTEIRTCFPVFDYCQAFLYSLFKSPKIPIFLVYLAMPLLILVNWALARCGKSGVIEFWARRPQ